MRVGNAAISLDRYFSGIRHFLALSVPVGISFSLEE
jgi:hypothetical protein